MRTGLLRVMKRWMRIMRPHLISVMTLVAADLVAMGIDCLA